ncbi:MAG: pitrilysin family protein [bacterium]|nr:pitrilysin family protein [bacterium]
MWLIRLLFLFLVAVNFTVPLSATTPHSYTLENGVKVVLLPDSKASLNSARVLVKTGSIDEAPLLGTGLSHYLEHLVAGGQTTLHSEEYYASKVASMGGASNAYTTYDHTAYYINSAPEFSEDAIDVLYEWMFFSEWNQSQFEREQKVILKEMERSDADLQRQFYYQAQQQFYEGHPLSVPVIGYRGSFLSLKSNALYEYYKRSYSPANMIVVVGGHFDMSMMKRKIDETFGSQSKRLGHMSERYHVSESIVPRVQSFNATSNVTMLSIRFPTVSLLNDDLFALDLLDYVLGAGPQSVLHQLLVETKNLAYSVQVASVTPRNDSGYFEIMVECDENHVDAVRSEIKSVLESTKLGQISNTQLKRARRKKLAEDVLSLSTMTDRVKREALSVFYTGSPGFFEQYARSFEQVSRNDLSRVAQHYFKWNKRAETIMIPASSLTQSILPESEDENLNAPEVMSLLNGVTVIFETDQSLPKAQITVVMKGGLLLDTPTLNGQTRLLTRLLGKGSKAQSRAKYLSQFEDRGAVIGASMGNQIVDYSLQAMAQDLPELISPFFDGLLQPLITTETMELEKRQQDVAILTRPDSWWPQASTMFHRHFFGLNSPFGLPQDGESESLAAVGVADLQRVHDQLINPSQMVISVVGDFNRDDVLEEIETYFSRLPAKPLAYRDVPKLAHAQSDTFHLMLKQNVGAVLIGFDGLDYDQLGDDVGLSLVDAVLSGARYPGGFLHKRLRGEGLVYVVHAFHTVLDGRGYFMIYALTDPKNVERVRDVILEEIEHVKLKPVNSEQFREAQAQVDFMFREQVESSSSRARTYAIGHLMMGDHMFFIKKPGYINQYTPDAVRQIANRYLIHPQVFIFNGK